VSEHTPGESPAGWYPDPGDPALRRYWDGSAWTAHTALAQAAQPTALQPHSHSGPKRAPPPPSDRGFFGWVSRRPRPAFWATLAAALIVGMGVGAAALQEDGARKPRNDSGALTEANEELSDARAGRKAAEKKLSKARDALEATEGQAGSTGKRRAPRPMASSSGGAVQSFSGNGGKSFGTISIPADSVLEWTNDGDVFQVFSSDEVPVNSRGKRGDTVLFKGKYRKFQVNAVGNWTIEIRPR